jgi:ubiquinone/menaquinone biosynthesis C-methylase UbiE
MSSHYLSHLAELGTADIHPHGHRATSALIKALDIQAGHHVLEIGCGTGNTAVLVSSSMKVQVTGIDAMPQMLSIARQRVRWAGDKDRVHLLQASGATLPFHTDAYDRIYTESVLGFQDETHAELMLSEIYRALKPGGNYVANEAIWKRGVSQAVIDAIKEVSINDFGLCQASPQAWSIEAWEELMRSVGFTVIYAGLIESAAVDLPAPPPTMGSLSALKQKLLTLRLAWFSRFYRIKRHWHPRLRRADRNYERRLKAHRRDGQYIEARLFVLQKSA